MRYNKGKAAGKALKMKRRSPAGGKCKPLSAAPKWLIISAFALLAVLAAVLLYRWYAVSHSAAGHRAHIDTFDSLPPAQIVFLHMDGCGWCDKFKPSWAEFTSQYGPSLSSAGVTAVSYERKDPAAASFGQVDGYPTVLFVVDKKRPVKFEGDRTPEGLIAFVRENGYVVVEGYDEPKSELGGIHSVVSSTKQAQDGTMDGQKKAIKQGAGGNLPSTSTA